MYQRYRGGGYDLGRPLGDEFELHPLRNPAIILNVPIEELTFS